MPIIHFSLSRGQPRLPRPSRGQPYPGDETSKELRLLRRRVDLEMQSLYKGAGEFLADYTNP